MKLIKCTNLLVIGLALSIVTGCHGKRPGTITKIPGRYEKTPDASDQSGKLGQGNATDQTLISTPLPSEDKHRGWTKNHELLKAETVYFALDSSEIKSDQKSKIQAVADYLRKENVDTLADLCVENFKLRGFKAALVVGTHTSHSVAQLSRNSN